VSELTAVLLVTLIVWIGLFLYLWKVDRAVRRLENRKGGTRT
jgi:CcmD family protein